MLHLVDNDVLFDLAQTKLLEEAREVLGVAHSEIIYLPSARYVADGMVRKGKFHVEALDELKRFLEVCTLFNDTPHKEKAAELSMQGIDSGEAMLFAHLANDIDKRDICITGDIKSLETLAKTTQHVALCNQFHGRAMPYAVLHRMLLDHHGYEAIQSKVTTNQSRYAYINVAYQPLHDVEHARECLNSAIRDAKNRAPFSVSGRFERYAVPMSLTANEEALKD